MFANRSRCLALAAAISSMTFSAAGAAEPASCGTVRFSDVGWTDITA
ncbi:MAG TPA: glycine/betaine ABC transporter substrate-binding protein, partial [Agrobacterium sp.]|nr:glycine/betaine ABC transporter substrate-binding protein [Agrobacterium sp.]